MLLFQVGLTADAAPAKWRSYSVKGGKAAGGRRLLIQCVQNLNGGMARAYFGPETPEDGGGRNHGRQAILENMASTLNWRQMRWGRAEKLFVMLRRWRSDMTLARLMHLAHQIQYSAVLTVLRRSCTCESAIPCP